MTAFVYWQSPAHLNEDHKISRIHQGQLIDVRLSLSKPARDSTPAAPAAPSAANNY